MSELSELTMCLCLPVTSCVLHLVAGPPPHLGYLTLLTHTTHTTTRTHAPQPGCD